VTRNFAVWPHFSVFGRIFSRKYHPDDLGATFFPKNRQNSSKSALDFGNFVSLHKFLNFYAQFLRQSPDLVRLHFGRYLDKIGRFFTQNIWSHWMGCINLTIFCLKKLSIFLHSLSPAGINAHTYMPTLMHIHAHSRDP
jgi:hypothetical protein